VRADGHAVSRLLGRGVQGASLHRLLLLWLLLPQLVLWAAGGVVSYQVALRYANRAIDANLLQSSRALARQVKPIGNGLLIDFPRAAQDVLEADPRDRVFYMVSTPPGEFILGNRRLPPPPPIAEPRLGEPYFYDGTMPPALPRDLPGAAVPARVRVAALYLAFGDDERSPQTMLVQVARSSASREELARSILLDTLLPLSGLIVLMSMIVWAGIRAGLAPLGRLRRLVEGRAPTDLAPLEIDAAPLEVRALARAVNELLASVQHHVAAQRRFIDDAAHQLRTPLAGLKGQTELALQATSDEAQRQRLQLVHESAARSAHLVNQLLALARAEPGPYGARGHQAAGPPQGQMAEGAARRYPSERVDLAALAQQLAAETVPRALQLGADLGFEGGDAPAWVRGSGFLLREALANVIDNALHYAGRGAEITVRVRGEGAQAVAEVEDDGPGIAEADRERVFERFVRATEQGRGCGLGLAIVKAIAEHHGGRVALATPHPERAERPGLRLELRLPCDTG
jgi:two-component system sensor histidine kinase TctE